MKICIKQLILITVLSLSNVSRGEGLFGYENNGADVPITGSASDQNANSAAISLQRCDKPFGTIAVSEPQSEIAQALSKRNLPPPTGLLRLIIQQSNCFVVVERGIAMKNLIQERQLSKAGELQDDSNIGKGQLVAADFILSPSVAFSDSNSGGGGGAVAHRHRSLTGAVIGAVIGGIKSKQAQTTLILADARSGIQVAAAEGNVEKTDWSIGGVLGGSDSAIGLGGYSSTAQGKVIAAALLNNYNNIVQTIRNKPDLISAKSPDPSLQNAKNSIQASVGLNSGDVIRPKINGVKVFSSADDKSQIVAKLNKQDELIYLGDENNGFIKVDGPISGWVDKRMILK